jgi:hypothetical protein
MVFLVLFIIIIMGIMWNLVFNEWLELGFIMIIFSLWYDVNILNYYYKIWIYMR